MNRTVCLTTDILTLQEGGADSAPPPIKTSLEAILTQFFDITLIGGQK